MLDFDGTEISQTSEFNLICVIRVSKIIMMINHFAKNLTKKDCKLLNQEWMLITV